MKILVFGKQVPGSGNVEVDTDERKKSVRSARSAFLEAVKASTAEMNKCDVVVPGKVCF